MKHRFSAFAAAVLVCALVFTMGACASKAGTGAAIGGGAGALAGAVIGEEEGAVIGALLGAGLGAGIGYALDVQDRRRAAQVLETAPTNHTEAWVNPDTGNRYELTPTETYYGTGGQPCREFSMDAYIGGRPQETWGTACRQADGSWRIVS